MPQVANNADDYAAPRQNIFFPGVTPDLDGQCVSLVKWFMAEMSAVPNPQAARGDARYVGKTLVSQGHAVEVPYDQRKRGDIICYEYGLYGHISVQLSGGRVFEENVNWAGVDSKIVAGARVYASRIGSEAEAWRHDQHVYRLKTYVESGGKKMVNSSDVTDLFLGILFRMPTSEEVTRYNGKIDGGDLARELNRSNERKELETSFIADEEAVRILAVAVLKRPEPLVTTDELRAHIGKHGVALIKEFWYSPEGVAGNKWQQDAQKGVVDTYEQIIEPIFRKVKKEK